jgi:nicotinamide-nucleotide amidase
MTAAIITIGDEIVLGQTLDTNSQWIADQLTSIGVSVRRMLSVGDTEADIVDALNHSSEELLILTGGLGPTSDDRTKNALCTYYDCELVFNDDVYRRIQEQLRNRPAADLELNRTQAMIPMACTSILNMKGTAPGMWFEVRGRILVSMPGVPEEMMAMMRDFVIPRLRGRSSAHLVHSYVMTAGMAESAIAGKLRDFEEQLPTDVSLAYLPSAGRVKLRLTSLRPKAELDRLASEAAAIIGDASFAHGDEISLEKHLGEVLRASGKTIGTAESCTGGYIAHRLTSVPGSSDYYRGSIIGYANEVKTAQLGVSPASLQAHGAVSEIVVGEMLQGLLKRLAVDYGIAVSGVAGPTGGTEEKPVGTVWLAIGSTEHLQTRQLNLQGDRMRIIEVTAVLALDALRKIAT